MTFDKWHDDFSRFAEDLYPGRYPRDYVKLLAEMGEEVRSLARQKNSTIVAHNYQYPKLREVAETVGELRNDRVEIEVDPEIQMRDGYSADASHSIAGL